MPLRRVILPVEVQQMKPFPRSTRTITAALFFLILIGDASITLRDALGRAGRGDSYRSSSSSSSSSSGSSWRSSSSRGSSSWYRSRSSSSSSSTSSASSSSSTSSTSSSSSSGSYTPAPKVVKDYDDYYTLNAWSTVLTVNRDGSVDVAETYDVTLTEYQKGLLRPLDQIFQYESLQYNTLMVTDLKCPQGYAEYKDGTIQFGFNEKSVTGKQNFLLNYRVTGLIVPAVNGTRLQWRPLLKRSLQGATVRIILPDGATPLRTKLLGIKLKSSSLYRRLEMPGEEKELPCTVAGNVITFPYTYTYEYPTETMLDLTVDLPAGVIDTAAAVAGLEKALKDKQLPSVREYRADITINEDRTVDRKETYSVAPESGADQTIMRSRPRFYSVLIREAKPGTDPSLLATGDHYFYGFDKGSCSGDDYGRDLVCVPMKKGGTARLNYSTLGNYNPKDPFFFELRIPSAHVKRSDRVSFDIALPPFVKKDEVQVKLYLISGFFSGNNTYGVWRDYSDKTKDEILLHEADFTSRWNGNRLICEYPAGLIDEQFLIARVFLPPAGFKDVGGFKSARITLSNAWHFKKKKFLIVSFIIACILAAVVVPIVRKRTKGAGTAATTKPPSPSASEKFVAEVRTEDPAFSPEAFLERCGTIAGKIQEAWSNGNMAPVRNLVSQGVYNRFRIQLKLMREQEKLHNLVGDFGVDDLSIIGTSLSHAYQTVHVRMNASARDTTVPVDMTEEEKKGALGKAKKTSFTEIYSFTRRRGAKTDAAKNLLAGQCPNCGNIADAAGESNKCKTCGTIYNSGEFDWVLSEITQGMEWNDDSAREVRGLAALEKENLSINRQVIEDRASYLFWRWIAGQATGSAAALGRDATVKFLQGFKPAAGYFAETAVGAADLQEVSRSGDEAWATILVLWSASFAKGKEPEHREHILTLTLPLQMKNPYGFADHGCDTCGAPLPESDAATCSYCGSALQKTNSDWLLDRVDEKN